MVNLISYSIAWIFNRIFGAVPFLRLMRLTKNPKLIQSAVLKRILKDSRDTQFGRLFRFFGIQDVEQFQSSVGMHAYRDLNELMRNQEASGTPLLCSQPFVYLTHSVGTNAEQAFPMTPETLRNSRRDVRLAAYAWLRRYGLWRGRVFAFLAVEPRSFAKSGLPQNTSTGFIFRNLPKFMRSRCFIPSALSSIRNPEDRYLALAIVGFAEVGVTCMMTPNPATFIQLVHTVNHRFEEIFAAIEQGQLPDHIQNQLKDKISLLADPRRATFLRETMQSKSSLGFGDIWPNLRGVICWTSGGCLTSLNHLRKLLPVGLPILELGYQSSAFLGTLNVDTKTNSCIPTFHRNFFEFAERSSWESGFGDLKTLFELVVGQEYYVFVTTQSGVYRLLTDQIVRTTGKVHNTPTIEVVQRGSSFTNLNGERLAESQIIDAVQCLNERHACGINQFVMLSDAMRMRYDLYVESDLAWETDLVETWFDDAIAERNSAYFAKRCAERLQPPTIHRIEPGTINRFRTASVRDGFSDPQVIFPHLQIRKDREVDLEAEVI